MKWLNPASYPAFAVFLAMGGFVAALAVNSYSLLQFGLANYRYISKFGWLALMEGGLVQLLEISLTGLVSLGFYLGFKVCEVDLMTRWRALGKKSAATVNSAENPASKQV